MSIKGFEVGGVQQQYDYTALDNIPANLVQDANYVHTDNNYTNADKTKLSGIEAQANKTTIDATLTHSGQAADAKATGDAISALNAQVIASMPHDTASGSIASFPDGAAMPIRDLSVDIEPVQDLNGYDNPWPAGGGVNLLPSGGAFDTTKNGIRFVSDGKGTYTITGTATADAYYEFSIAEINIPSTAYIHMLNNVSTYSIAFVFFNGNTQITAPTPVPVNAIKDVSATLGGKTVNKLRLFVANGYTANLTFSPMLCVDNTVKPFSPYSNICPISGWTGAKVYVSPTTDPADATVYTIDLDGTRYGGTLDVTTGKLTVDRLMFTPTELKAGVYVASNMYYPWVDVPQTAIAYSDGLCNKLWCATSYVEFIANISFVVRDTFIAMNLNGTGYSSRDDAIAAGATFIQSEDVQFCYELAATIEVDLDPVTIETLLGTNNIFADCGDITVDYYADTTLFVNKKIAAAVAALS